LPSRLHGEREQSDLRLRLDDLVSSPDHPGFQILIEDPPREVSVGAIGKVWHPAGRLCMCGDAQRFQRRSGCTRRGFARCII
jgi:hypothetical protein